MREERGTLLESLIGVASAENGKISAGHTEKTTIVHRLREEQMRRRRRGDEGREGEEE